MAIRDRVTIKTKDGTVTGMVVQKQGGYIEVTEPKPPREPYWKVEVMTKTSEPTGEEVTVPADQVIFVLRDKEPKAKK